MEWVLTPLPFGHPLKRGTPTGRKLCTALRVPL